MRKIILFLAMLPLVGCGSTHSTTTTYSSTPAHAVSKTYTPGGGSTVTTYAAPTVQQRTVTTTTN